MKQKLKKYGKWGLYAFLAYQVVGLIIVILSWDTIMTQSQDIAYDIIGGK
jgi:hypothetical protein